MMNRISANHRFSIIGGAKSGIAVAKLLRSTNARVFLSELQPAENMLRVKEELERIGVEYELGGHTSRALDADTMVVSPGVPSDAPIIEGAKKSGLKVLSEIEVASWFCKAPIVAITGSNGKTTTTSLIGAIFKNAAISSVVAGNIGFPFSDFVGELNVESVAIIEVSSFQLDNIETFKPKASILLNITPDHLDRYGRSFDRYIESKCRIFENQTTDDFTIYNYDDEITRHVVETRAKSRKLPFSVSKALEHGAFVDGGDAICLLGNQKEAVVRTEKIHIRGMHNLYNSLAATLAARVFGIRSEVIRDSLMSFEGVAHRLEFVRELNGVKYFNDSKATNVDSVWYALGSFDEPIILIAGGRDKGNDYTRLYDLVRHKVRAVVLIGEAAEKIEREFRDLTEVLRAISMEDAVHKANRMAKSGDVVLLSPACASFDMFKNYEHRGEVFKSLVNAL